MENILSNINSLLLIFDISPNSNLCDKCLSITTYYLSDYEYKLDSYDDSIINYINYFLELINSKFFLKKDMIEDEFINYILFFFYEYDIIEDYINYLKNYEKDNISISIDNIINFQNSRNPSESNILRTFNKMNQVCKNLKNQVDLFINSTYKLNKIKNIQEKPINNLKIEELIVFNDNIFKKYIEFIRNKQIFLEESLLKCEKMIENLDDTINIYRSISKNIIISNINHKYSKDYEIGF